MGEGYDAFLEEVTTDDPEANAQHVADMMSKPHVIVAVGDLKEITGMEERYIAGVSMQMAGGCGMDNPSDILAMLELGAMTLRDAGVKAPWEL